MTKDDILNMADNPQYIEGVYNYCDRWCERCSLTSRCLNYAITEENFGEVSVQDLGNKEFWEKLKQMFQLTIEMLVEWADENDIDLNNVDIEAAAAKEKQQRIEAEQHELARTAWEYGKTVDQWFEIEKSLFEELQEELSMIAEFGDGRGKNPFQAADEVNDAVEVIRWYQHQIYVKFMRALTRDRDEDESDDELLAVSQQDADGSVKVALIGIDRSIGAWGVLRNHFPERGDDLNDLLLELDRLRRKAEHYFPNARNFIRPGFDTLEGLS